MHLLISWRNIWRNPRRTAIILVAIVIGAWAMLFFASLSRGMIESMLTNSLNTLTGHIQIQKPQYRDDPVVENRIENPGPIQTILEATLPPGSIRVNRIQVDGVASNARNSEGVAIIGIEPDKEADASFYGDAIVAGRLLDHDDAHGIVVGKAFVDAFDTKLGRKVVLMTQGADRETASRAFKIRGIYRAELQATEKRYVFITLAAARELLGVNTAVTNICVKLADRGAVAPVAESLRTKLPDDLATLTWKQMLPLLTGYIGMFDSFMLLWYLVVFVAMAFGLINTMLMAVLERTREFGLLKALGMKPIWIVRGVLTECLILLTIGLAIGNLAGFASIHALSDGLDLSFVADGSEYFGMGNIIVPFLTVRDILSINCVILGLGLIVCLYPALKAGRITPIEAMAHN